MSLLNKASLIQIPSGYKDGTLYSVKPTNGDGDFTFSRGSNLSATRVNSEGLIEKGRENLLLQSNTFDTTWYNSGTALTSGQAGYDGTNDAWLASRGGGYNYVAQDISTSGVQSYSIYAKVGSFDWIYVRVQNSASAYRGAYFDLSSGSVGTVESGIIDTKIEAAGNGYYRCTIIFNESLNRVLFYPVPSNNGVGTGGTGTIYIQDAQLELGLVSTDVITTTTTTAQAGILEDMPRLDYSGGATCPSLLLEPQRSNLALYSEQFDNAYWGKTAGTTITANTTISPDGYTNAYTIAFAAGGDSVNKIISTGLSVVSGTTYTISVFTKSTTQVIFFGGATGGTGTNVYNGSVDYGNGWYRQSVTRTWSASGTVNVQVVLSLPSAGSTIAYGFQAELGSYPTSYIPTYGSSVTRSADSCSKTGISSLIGQTEGVLYAEVDLNVKIESGSPVSGILTTNNNVSDLQNCIILGVERNASGTNSIYCLVQVSNVTQAALFGSSITSGNYKIALAYKANDFALYVNGVQVATDTSGSVPTTSQVLIGTRRNSDNFTLADRVSQAIVFPTRLTNDELATLTTI
jgi:hypothetical protein